MEPTHTIVVQVGGVRVYLTSVNYKTCLYIAGKVFPGQDVIDHDVRYR